MARRVPESRKRAVRAFLELSERERVLVLEELLTYVGADIDAGEDERLEVARRRVDALEAVMRATDHLRENGQLKSGQAISSTRFTEVAGELDLGWSAAAVTRVFGRWRNATAAAAGEAVRAGPAERRLRRRLRGRDMGRLDYIEGVRLWLASKPDGHQWADYNDFADKENARRGDEAPHLVKAAALNGVFGLPWSTLLKVARGEVGLTQAKRENRAQLLASFDSELVGGRDLAALLQVTPAEVADAGKTPGFPSRVAIVSGARAYLTEDVLAYRDGLPFPQRQVDELQPTVLDTGAVAELLGLEKSSLVAAIHREDWHRVPSPSGRVGTKHFWWTARFANWDRARDADDRRSP